MLIKQRCLKCFIISEENLKLLGTRYSYDEYAEFFEAELSPHEVPEELILDEPSDFPTDIDDVPESEENALNAEDAEESEDDEDSEDSEEEEEVEDDEDWLP